MRGNPSLPPPPPEATAAYDPADLARLYDRLYQPITDRLGRKARFRHLDVGMIVDGVMDALIEQAMRPADLPSAARSLEAVIAVAAERNVLNRLRGEGRRKRRERAVAAVTPESGDGRVELRSPAGNLIAEEDAGRRQADRERLLARLTDPVDRRVLELQLAGERRTDRFAEAMGIAGLPAAERRARVKRAKDRIDKLLRRAVRDGGAPDGGGGGDDRG